jgi:hypothetical protein
MIRSTAYAARAQNIALPAVTSACIAMSLEAHFANAPAIPNPMPSASNPRRIASTFKD